MRKPNMARPMAPTGTRTTPDPSGDRAARPPTISATRTDMFRRLVSTAVVTLLLATPSSAQQLDAETQLMLQGGAGYLIAAEHEDLEGTDADRQTLRDMG